MAQQKKDEGKFFDTKSLSIFKIKLGNQARPWIPERSSMSTKEAEIIRLHTGDRTTTD